MRVGSDDEAPHRIEPSVNTTIALQNTVRAPKRSATQPEAGMNTASVSMYEVSASLRTIGS